MCPALGIVDEVMGHPDDAKERVDLAVVGNFGELGVVDYRRDEHTFRKKSLVVDRHVEVVVSNRHYEKSGTFNEAARATANCVR